MFHPIPLLILACFLPSIGPAPTPTDIEVSLTVLLRESWAGTWTRGGQTDAGLELEAGMLTLPMRPAWLVPLALIDEGNGRFRGTLGEDDDEGIVGIWKYDESRRRLVLCWRGTKRGYPERFDDSERQDLITLWEK